MRIDTPPNSRPKKSVPNVEEAELIAVEALSFLALDMGRLSRFIEMSGLSVESLREAAGAPGFFPAVLDYVASDESLLMTFAVNGGYDPLRIIEAKNLLSPQIDLF